MVAGKVSAGMVERGDRRFSGFIGSDRGERSRQPLILMAIVAPHIPLVQIQISN